MELLSVIGRWHLRDRMPIREIARRTGLSRNTILKYLRSGAVEPQFRVPGRCSKLDPFAEKLSHWLRIEAAKSRKQRCTVKQLHADLVVLGFDGSYGRVAAFARAWKAQRQYEQQTSGRGTFVPLVFAPGEAFQFDWSEDCAVLGGERVKLQAAHTKLAHSKAFIVRAYLCRLFAAQGHEIRLMSPEYVQPYVKAQNNDDRIAEGIAGAASRPAMRFLELKTEKQLNIQTLHRVRSRRVNEWKNLINQIRAILLERGTTSPVGVASSSRVSMPCWPMRIRPCHSNCASSWANCVPSGENSIPGSEL